MFAMYTLWGTLESVYLRYPTFPYICRDVTNWTLRGEIKIEFCITCSRGHSTGHFDTKFRCLAQFLSELLLIL